MANTYSQIYIQVVFAVQCRQYLIRSDFREEVQKYITGITTERGQKLLSIYCMPDHTHLLLGLKPSMALSDLVRDIKNASSNFINSCSINRPPLTGFLHLSQGLLASVGAVKNAPTDVGGYAGRRRHACAGFLRFSAATIAQSTAKPSTPKAMRVVQLGTLVFSASRRMVMGLRSSVCKTWLKL